MPDATVVSAASELFDPAYIAHQKAWPADLKHPGARRLAALAEALLVHLGVPMGPVIASIHEKRAELRAAMQNDATNAPRRLADVACATPASVAA